jgi:lantibiotic modifying enzyme
MVESTDNGGMPGGFTNGAAGIGWALSRFGAAGGGSRYVQAGLAAISAATRATATHRAAMPTDGWCGGTAGVVAARAGVGSDDGDLEWAVKSLASRPVLGDLSLCHGELGVAEALNVLAARQPGGSAARARRRRAGLVLDAIGRYGVSCGTPGGVATPGLMSGLAGIGYGLLRLGFADRVPSVLLLEATPAGPTIDKQQTKQKEN